MKVRYNDKLTVDVEENDALCASPRACAVADAWCENLGRVNSMAKLFETLTALELATRESPLRKVLP